MDKLPIVELVIEQELDSELQVDYVALVDRPAIERNFLAFNDRPMIFADDDRRIISGPAMLADTPICRRDPDLGDFNVVFTAPTIYQIVQKFFKKGFAQNFNLFHNPEMRTGGVTVFESFITDKSRGIKPMTGFEDAPEGSWFISAFVEDDAAWKAIKSGKVKGFSVEGIFKYKPKKKSEQDIYEQIRKLLEQI